MEITVDEALQQGMEAHKKGQIQEADRLYTAILKMKPQHPDANHNLGILAFQLGKLEQALALFENALQAGENRDRYWLSYLETLIKLGRTKEAQKGLDQAMWKGVKKKTLQQVTRQLRQANSDRHQSNLAPEPPREQLQALLELYQQGEVPQMLTRLKFLLQQFPNSANLYNLQGAAQRAIQKPELAVESYRQAVALQPRFMEAHNNLGNLLKSLGHFAEAEACFRQALQLRPDMAEVHSNLGTTLQALGQLVDADASYREALRLKPEFAEAHHNLGNVLKSLGRDAEATAHHQEALRLKPELARVRQSEKMAVQS